LSDFHPRLLRFAKATTLFSAAWTIMCAVFLTVGQIALWLKNGVWDSYPISSVINRLKTDQAPPYLLASSDKLDAELINNPELANWLLRIPAIVPLLIASALLLAFYLLIRVIEKDSYPH
jgi:hypothetical protein